MALYGTKSSFMVLHVPSSNAMLWNIDLLVTIFLLKVSNGMLWCVLCHIQIYDPVCSALSWNLRLNTDHNAGSLLFQASTCRKIVVIACDDRAYPLYGNLIRTTTFEVVSGDLRARYSDKLNCHYRLHQHNHSFVVSPSWLTGWYILF
jgi:hypothetical protein